VVVNRSTWFDSVVLRMQFAQADVVAPLWEHAPQVERQSPSAALLVTYMQSSHAEQKPLVSRPQWSGAAAQ
jgi:hypothetical protein